MSFTELFKPVQFSREKKIKNLGEGPWIDNPDWDEFEYKGYDCLIRKILFIEQFGHIYGGHYTGYVKVKKNNPLYGLKSIYDEKLFILEVHEGITFCETEDDITIIGFDCAHSCDIIPSTNMLLKDINKKSSLSKEMIEFKSKYFPKTYKDYDFVKNELKSLVDQLLVYPLT